MSKLLAIVISSVVFSGVAFAQAPAAGGNCESKAVSKAGKPLAGAAKTSFLKKCNADAAKAAASSACEAKAVSKDGKPLSGAAKTSSVKKCMASAK
jgi:hypothetical protein